MAVASGEQDPLIDGEPALRALLQEASSNPESADPKTPVEPLPTSQKPVVRAKILRRILLGLPLIEGYEPGPLLPRAGFTFQNLLVTGELDLQDARDSGGDTLPPVAFEHCIFLKPIDLSGARFTTLALRDCHIVHLKGIGLHVEESLDISGSRSTQDLKALQKKYELGKKTGAIVGTPRRELPELPQPLSLEPNESNDKIRNLQEIAGERRGLCWIELRNAHIGVDLDASECQLVCPEERLEFRNCPHANYALDLRGSTIKGRLSLNTPQADRQKSKLKGKRILKPFEAVGGVSLVRCFVGGSVCASGSRLIAVEGNAFTAQRAEIKGHVFLDYSYEGWDNWTPFIAFGFIDLNNVRILSSLQLSGAALLCDHLSRAGLVASGAEIGDKCWLCGIEAPKRAVGLPRSPDTPEPAEDEKEFFRFFTDGGVNLSRAVVKGGLDLRGARLYPSSFATALHAPGLTVHGEVKMTALNEKKSDETKFVARGSVDFFSARLHRGLQLKGADLKSRRGKDTKEEKSDIPANFRPFIAKSLPGEYPATRRLLQEIGINSPTPAALRTDMATISSIGLEHVDCTGPISMTDMTCSHGIEAERLILRDGTLDFLKARLGYLYLKEFWLTGTPHPGDLHIFVTAANTETETKQEATEGEKEEATTEANQEKTARPQRVATADAKQYGASGQGQGADVLHFLNAHITGKLTITRRYPQGDCTLTLSDETQAEVGRYLRPCANLRELRVGALDDDSSLGWGTLCLKLEGFSCDRAPSRRLVHRPINAYGPLRKNSGKSIWTSWRWIFPYLVQQILCLLFFKTKTYKDSDFYKEEKQRARSIKKDHSRRRNEKTISINPLNRFRYWVAGQITETALPHRDFLDRQYQNPYYPSIVEFTASAYDRLAESLQFDGRDREARKVLSQKLKMMGRVDTFWLVRPIWAAFGLFFDYGLSSFRTILTYCVCLFLGCIFWGASTHADWAKDFVKRVPFAVRVADASKKNALWKWLPDFASNTIHDVFNSARPLVYAQSLMPTQAVPVIDGKTPRQDNPKVDKMVELTSEASICRRDQIAIGKDGNPEPKACTAYVDSLRTQREIPCPPLSRWDSLFYSVDTFVPYMDRLRPNACEISIEEPTAKPWRFFRTLYSLAGGIITFITLLTLPGFLRKRAEG